MNPLNKIIGLANDDAEFQEICRYLMRGGEVTEEHRKTFMRLAELANPDEPYNELAGAPLRWIIEVWLLEKWLSSCVEANADWANDFLNGKGNAPELGNILALSGLPKTTEGQMGPYTLAATDKRSLVSAAKTEHSVFNVKKLIQ